MRFLVPCGKYDVDDEHVGETYKGTPSSRVESKHVVQRA